MDIDPKYIAEVRMFGETRVTFCTDQCQGITKEEAQKKYNEVMSRAIDRIRIEKAMRNRNKEKEQREAQEKQIEKEEK